jgi:hypothetical protein
MITHQDVKNMSESELAVFAAKGRSQLPGLTLLQWEDGSFSFSAIDLLSPAQLAKIRIIGCAH